MGYSVVDLFCGAGGLSKGFMDAGFDVQFGIDWDDAALKTFGHNHGNAEAIKLDLFNLDNVKYIEEKLKEKNVNKLDVLIGGPPCQAYSVAGRNAGRMKDDYRNYLFEHYISVINRYQPKLFVFENVPGMLSAMPDGTLITDLIKRDLSKIGYEIIENIKEYALIDTSEFGVPQTRKRVILIGIKSNSVNNPQELLKHFYEDILPKYKSKKVFDLGSAIGDLPPIYPVTPYKENGKNISHKVYGHTDLTWHVPRYQNERDIEVFKKLCKDIEDKTNLYSSTSNLIKLYEETTGKKTSVHKYHVLRKDEPSTTILAHLHKDGFRFIHYDSKQARTITVREAARIQTFADDFDFPCSMGAAYKMIGNAVPSLFAKKLAQAVNDFISIYLGDE